MADGTSVAQDRSPKDMITQKGTAGKTANTKDGKQLPDSGMRCHGREQKNKSDMEIVGAYVAPASVAAATQEKKGDKRKLRKATVQAIGLSIETEKKSGAGKMDGAGDHGASKRKIRGKR